MKTIGILLGSLAGAGAEKSLLTLATALAQRGNKVHLVLLKDVLDFTPPKSITITLLKGENRAAELHDFTASITFDLFVCSRVELYWHIQCSNKWGFVCITPTAWIDTPRWRPLKLYRAKKKLRKYLDKNLIAVSKGIADDLVENIGVEPQRVRVIYNAYDFTEITTMATEPASLPQEEYILCVGALKQRKGQAVLLRAFARIANKHIKLLLLGKGEMEQRLRQLAHRLGISDRVVFAGWVPNPYPYIANAKLCVLASTAEGLPRVVVESLLLGIPVVSTDCRSGPNELLTGELANFLIPVDDYKTMARKIDNALDNYPTISKKSMQKFDSLQTAIAYESLGS